MDSKNKRPERHMEHSGRIVQKYKDKLDIIGQK